MKFGLEVVLKGGKVLGFFYPEPHPPDTGCVKEVLGVSGASACVLAKTL